MAKKIPVRRIINDISLNRFVKEVIHYARKHPEATFGRVLAEDDSRAEEAFMFSVAMEYEVIE